MTLLGRLPVYEIPSGFRITPVVGWIEPPFELKLDPNLDAAVSMKTSAGGSIKNSLTNDQPSRAKYGPASNLQFSSGNGSGSIDISTVSGRLELSKN